MVCAFLKLVVLLYVCLSMEPVFGVFHLISENVSQWRCYYSPNSSDCMVSSVLTRFPEILEGPRPAGLRNFTITYFEREALELGGYPDYFYPGIIVQLKPGNTISDTTRGYEVVLKKVQTTCLIIIIPAYSSVDQVTQELFPLSGTTHYRISVHALRPLLNHANDHSTETLPTGTVYDVVTGRFHDYRPDGRYPAPADWIAIIHYIVNVYENGTGQSLDVVFSRPPDMYRFKRFQVALVGLPEEANIQVQVDVTTNYWHVFPDVKRGRYKVSVKPLDDFFSVAGHCLCYDQNGLCTNCLTTETEIFTVD